MTNEEQLSAKALQRFKTAFDALQKEFPDFYYQDILATMEKEMHSFSTEKKNAMSQKLREDMDKLTQRIGQCLEKDYYMEDVCELANIIRSCHILGAFTLSEEISLWAATLLDFYGSTESSEASNREELYKTCTDAPKLWHSFVKYALDNWEKHDDPWSCTEIINKKSTGFLSKTPLPPEDLLLAKNTIVKLIPVMRELIQKAKSRDKRSLSNDEKGAENDEI